MNKIHQSTIQHNFECAGRDLRPGDVVKVFDGPYGTGTVKSVHGDMVEIFRPYADVVTTNYNGTNKVLLMGERQRASCRVGIEDFSVSIAQSWFVYHGER